MAWPPFNCASCGHPAGTAENPVHAQAAPHPCNANGGECFCQAFNYNGYRASDFEGGGGGSGGGGSSGGW